LRASATAWLAEHGDQRDQPAARSAEVAQRGPQQVGDHPRFRLEALDQRGRAGPARAQLAERQPDQHRAAARPLDQGVGERRRHQRAGQLTDQLARLARGQAAEPERGEPGQRQVLPAGREERGRRRAREVLDHHLRLRFVPQQVRVVQADQRPGLAQRPGDQVELLVEGQGVLHLPLVADRRCLVVAVADQEPGQQPDDGLGRGGDPRGQGHPADRAVR
jgi:hypothetical protein